jgi:PAS domain S-box-containing protein
MNRAQKRQGYLIATAGVLIVLVIRVSLRHQLEEQAILLPFILAIGAAAWRGGLGPGVLATVLSTCFGVYFITPPLNSAWVDRIDYVFNAGTFVIIGLSVSALYEALHQARRRETEKQFRTLADTIPQLVWMARPDGYRFWFNRQWYEYTGAESSQLEGWGWLRMLDHEEVPAITASWRAALANGTPWEETYRLRRRDGEMRWVLGRARPLRNDRGEIECWFGTSTDISERREIELALKQANRHKDEFVATLAHELRNPLAPIGSALELWPHVEDDKQEMRQLREVIGRQTRQINRLVDDLLDVSRISQGKILLQIGSVNFAALVEHAVKDDTAIILAKNLRVVVDLPNAPLMVEGDEARLTQVVVNLLNNAAKYTPQGGIIWVSARSERDQLRLSVRDNGIGIEPCDLQKIFGIFEQLPSASCYAQGGLGLGLTLVRHLVELHGGSIVARSDGPGTGSEFVVMLPLHAATSHAAESAGGMLAAVGVTQCEAVTRAF